MNDRELVKWAQEADKRYYEESSAHYPTMEAYFKTVVNGLEWAGIGVVRVNARKDLLDGFVKAGMDNGWIAEAVDPPFTARSIVFCDSIEELALWVYHGNWAVGSGFAIGDTCWIEQTECGGEYLGVKGEKAFESASLRRMMTTGGFVNFIGRCLKEDCLQRYEIDGTQSVDNTTIM